MTDCELALLRILEGGATVNITRIAEMANVSLRHARRCLNDPKSLGQVIEKFLVPGSPARILIKPKKEGV